MSVTYVSRLKNIASQIDAELRAALGETANDIGTLAQDLAPRDTGDLAASKQVKPAGDGWIVSFGEGLPDIRAIAQEYGTDTQPAQPFLTPAVENIDPVARAKARLAALISRNRV
jgi:HK97 gp10 family phage protein